jgi:glycosyltransferase involved in cell wall biosynthesis
VRLAILASHPIQYQAPLFRELARRVDLMVFFAHQASRKDQADAGFGVGFEWDVDLLSGYRHTFLDNVAKRPGLDHFAGSDTPSITAHFARQRFDAVLVMGWHLKCFWQAIWAAKRAGLPVMVRGDSHLKTPRTGLKRVGKAVVYPLALRVFDAALYVGEHSRRYWEHYGYPRHRLVFSPHCVDNAWFAARATPQAGAALRAAHGIAQDAKVVLFAGKLLPFKRPADVLGAARVLATKGRPVAVMIAGAGPLADEITALAAATGVRLINLGFCNQTEMPRAYAAADVLVLPSDGGETWGLVANEALASGTPIIVSDACGCAPDLAADGLAGRVVPLGDIDALAAAMIDLLDRPPGRRAIGDKIGRYSLTAAADGVIEAVDLVASGSTA